MRYYIVDAFADKLFSGNQAGVCLLEQWLPKDSMQNIAAENNLAETAFVVKQDGYFGLRWFTPEMEIDLCGHATLATAFVISTVVEPDLQTMRFETMSGTLTVEKTGDMLEMDFPARMPSPIPVTSLMEEAIGQKVLEAHLSRDVMLVVESQQQVAQLQPNLDLLGTIPGCMAVIVTAKGDSADFVSRFFAPGAGIPEDPVTGSAHSTLIPYWAKQLGKQTMVARQLSKRGGTLYCKNAGERVKIAGRSVLYLQGEILL